ncbi:MAG: hypothetical protein JW818_15200 [Pirellulales bacterium]|nr:hypothetical protein [Pirellulales bacterium]
MGIYKNIWLCISLCLVLGCTDQTPKRGDTAAPESESSAGSKTPTTINGNDPKEVIRRAIAAFGGDTARNKLKNCRLSARWVATMPGVGVDNTVIIEDCFCYPDKWRRTARQSVDGAEMMLSVLNGNSHWARIAGKKVQELPLPQVDMRKPAILLTLDRLASLLESQQEIVVGADKQIAGKTLIPLTLTTGQCQSTTYFDRATGLIAIDTKNIVPNMHSSPETWKKEGPVESETMYGDYKNFEGVMLPTRMIVSQAGKTVLDMSILQVEFPSKFDAHTFDKPDEK